MLRVLQTHKANCTKENDDLEKVAYLCTVLADTSTVNRIKIDSDFNFDSQDITIAGISPIASGLMDNVQNALEEYDSLFESDIYILEHSIITANERNKNFNITGIINDPKPTFNNTDLELKINIDKESVTEANINCTIYNINGTNYTLNCLGEKNILYNLQSSISFIGDDLLLVNFDDNMTHEIIFNSSNFYRYVKTGSNSINTGGIVAIVLFISLALATIITLICLRKKLFRNKYKDTQESAVLDLNIS